MAGGHLEEGDAGGEDVSSFAGWKAGVDVGDVDEEFGVVRRGGVDIFVGRFVMTRGEEGAEVDEFHAAFANEKDVVGLEVDDDDAELVELGENIEGFVDGFLELIEPGFGETFVGGGVAPGLEVFAVEKFHGDVGVFLVVVNVAAVVSGNESAEGFVVDDVFEVGEFEAEAGVGAVGDFVRAIAVAGEVEKLDDNIRVVSEVNSRLGGLLEDFGEGDATETGKIQFEACKFGRNRCCCFDRHRTCGKIRLLPTTVGMMGD